MEVFVGRWTARGTSYGGTDQSGPDPKANGQDWFSTHETRWHTGSFFLVEDERADIEGYRFDTLSIMGVADDGDCFSRTFENHGFHREYQLTNEGNVWHIAGPSERAAIRFEGNNRRQVISWEWKQKDEWLPLCDRTAIRVD